MVLPVIPGRRRRVRIAGTSHCRRSFRSSNGFRCRRHRELFPRLPSRGAEWIVSKLELIVAGSQSDLNVDEANRGRGLASTARRQIQLRFEMALQLEALNLRLRLLIRFRLPAALYSVFRRRLRATLMREKKNSESASKQTQMIRSRCNVGMNRAAPSNGGFDREL